MSTPNIDSQYLKELAERLVASSKHSIYLNAMPKHYLTRLDISELNCLGAETAQAFVQNLLSKTQFRFPVTASPLTELPDLEREQQLMQKINTLCVENEDYNSEYGVKTFGFGFPLLAWRSQAQPEQLVLAPLTIWTLDVERDLQQPSQWFISRNADHAIAHNRVLGAFLARHAGVALPPLYATLLEDDLLSEQELAQWMYAQMYSFNPNLPQQICQEYLQEISKAPRPLPTEKELEQLPFDRPVIYWSGMFGLFRAPKEPLLLDIERLLKPTPELAKYLSATATTGVRPDFMRHPFAMVETDPSQQRLIYALAQGNHLIIQGAPGTGKSQTLSGLISNALSNGAKCLIVSEKQSAIESILQQLKNIELGELAAIIEDEYRDRAPIVQSVRDRLLQLGSTTYQPSPNFMRLLQSAIAQMQKLQRYYHKIAQPISGYWTWGDVVGKWLEVADNLPPKIQLDAAFQASEFKFTAEELDLILQILPEGEQLFQKVKSLQHPFNALNDKYFQSANIHQTEDDIRKALQNLLKALDSAQRDLLTCLFDYEQELRQHFDLVFNGCLELVSQIEQLLDEHFKSGKHLLHKKTLGSRLFSMFVTGSKEAEQAKDTIVDLYTQLIAIHAKFKYFKHDFYNVALPDANTEDLRKNLEDYQSKLSDWFNNIQTTIQDTVNQLAPDKVHPHTTFKPKVAVLITNLDQFERNIGGSQLLKVAFRFSSTNLRRRLTDMEGIDKNMKLLEEKLPEFKDYHLLKFYWNNLNNAQRGAFRGLSTLGLPNWEAVFAGWYYGALLARYADEFLPREDNYRTSLAVWDKERGEVQQLLRQHSLRLWRARQAEAVQQYSRKNNGQSPQMLYNIRQRASTPPTPLRDIMNADIQLFTSFFPVLLMSPAMAASLLPLQPDLFDVVVFDEASQLPLESTVGSFVRGKHIIISGDSRQIPPPSVVASLSKKNDENEALNLLPAFIFNNNAQTQSDSLLEFAAADTRFKEEMLRIHYRSLHPALIDFSNAAFYANRLIPMPASESYIPLQLVEVDGVWEDGGNVKEARRIVDLLLEIEAKQPDKNSLPRLGVVTFTLAQRNIILEWIQQRSIQDTNAAVQLQRLVGAGLFVKNFENIQGDQCDVLVISTTFAKQNDGNFQPDFAWLLGDYGYRLLNVIITRARHSVHVVTSIPEAHYKTYTPEIQRRGNTGKAILYAYLSYVKAIASGDENTRVAILKLLSEHCSQQPLQWEIEQDNLFERYVFNWLAAQLDDYQLEQNAVFAGFKVPLLVKDICSQPRVALFFDLRQEGRGLEDAFAWDIFIEQHFTRLHLPLMRLWSYNWWNDLQGEQQRLWAFLQENLKIDG